MQRCASCRGGGKLTREEYESLEAARHGAAYEQIWGDPQACAEVLQGIIEQTAASVGDARGEWEARARARTVEREAHEQKALAKHNGLMQVLSYPLGIVVNYLYLHLNNSVIFTGNAGAFDPISRCIYIAVMWCVPIGASAGCLGNLLAIVVIAILYILHLGVCLLLWIPVALVIQYAFRARK